MSTRARNVVCYVLLLWPGWCNRYCAVVLLTSGALLLAASHPGHSASPTARLGSLAGSRRFTLDDLSGIQRPGVAIGPIVPRGATLTSGTPVAPPVIADSLYVFWPPRPAGRHRSPPTAGPPVPPEDSRSARDDKPVAGSHSWLEDSSGDEDEDPDDPIDADPGAESAKFNFPPLVHLVSPNGREQLVCDSTLVIGWHAVGRF